MNWNIGRSELQTTDNGVDKILPIQTKGTIIGFAFLLHKLQKLNRLDVYHLNADKHCSIQFTCVHKIRILFYIKR
jgi:hypothetical protein